MRRGKVMRLLANILWFILGGFISFIELVVIGLILCITIVGIPLGKQFFKLGAVSFLPFGADIRVKHVL